MANENLGITVMELFAYNPYRILGIPVNAEKEQIEQVYHSLNLMCENDTIATYKSPFDFPSLPSFERNADSIAAAYSKLSGDVYRCFAFAKSHYAVSLSQADVSIQISNLDSYDKFLSCYMWLIINDMHLSYKNLWFKMAKHIDMLICSDPSKWVELFDHRFPKDVYENDFDSVKGFYTTFCEVILLPLKELVKGSMDCITATEILSDALFDGDVTAFMNEMESSERVKKTGRKTPGMKDVSGVSIVEESADKPEEEEEEVNLLEGVDEEENIYTETLNLMIKSNRARNQEIISLDTTKAYGSGNLGKDDDVELTMSDVNPKTYDAKNLASPYEIIEKEDGKKEMNIDISDMLNPQIKFDQKAISQMRDNFSGKYDYEEVEEAKVRHKTSFILKLTVFIIVVAVLGTVGYLYQEQIVDFVKDVIDMIKDYFDK